MGGLPAEPRRVFGLPQQRQKAIDVLNHCYASDLLDLTELENRLALAEQASTLDDLDRILADIPQEYRAEDSPLAQGVSDLETLVTKMSTKKVSDGVLLTRVLDAEVTMGNLILDYRNLALPAGVLEVRLEASMSNLRVFLPPGVQVELRLEETMSTIREQQDYMRGSQKPVTVLKISGTAHMSTVKILRKGRFRLWWEGVRGPKA